MFSSEAILAILAFGDMEDALKRQVLKTTKTADVIPFYCTQYHYKDPNFFKSEGVGV